MKEKYDLDGNSAIDVSDFLAFVDVFGQTVQTPPVEGSVAGDRAALIDLYNATDGDNWAFNWYWKSDKPIGEWYGVQTDSITGRVIRFNLGAALSGTLPSSIGNLTELKDLGLYYGELRGAITIPKTISNLTKLDYVMCDFK